MIDHSATGTTLVTPIRFRVYALMSFALVLLVVGLLSWASISRKFTGHGLVLPAIGLVELRAPGPFRVGRWLAAEGAPVDRGAALVELFREDSASPELLRAPSAGTLYRIEPQSPADRSAALGWFAPAGPLTVSVAVSARVRVHVQPGSEVTVRIEGLEDGRRFSGHVRSVALAPLDTDSGASTGDVSYPLVVDLDDVNDPAHQRQLLGLRAEVGFTLERRPLYSWLFDPAGTLFSE